MTILDKIVDDRKELLRQIKKNIPESSLVRNVDDIREFNPKKKAALICECKKASPSKGVFLNDYNPVEIAREYENGGADAISVLTEPLYFKGTKDDLINVRNNVSIPVLRKDFIFDIYQIKEAWAWGADILLLIVSILSKSQLNELYSYAKELGLYVLCETHNEKEIEIADEIGFDIIGINARNLKDFSVSLDTSINLKKYISPEKVSVAESGILSTGDAKRLRENGFDAFLIGEYLIRSFDRTKTLRELRQAIDNV